LVDPQVCRGWQCAIFLSRQLSFDRGALMPTALDNDQRSPRKLLAVVVRRLVLPLKRT
jgi:hypothetical protein